MSVCLLTIFIAISFFFVRAGAIAFGMIGMGWQQANIQILSVFSRTVSRTQEVKPAVSHSRRKKSPPGSWSWDNREEHRLINMRREKAA